MSEQVLWSGRPKYPYGQLVIVAFLYLLLFAVTVFWIYLKPYAPDTISDREVSFVLTISIFLVSLYGLSGLIEMFWNKYSITAKAVVRETPLQQYKIPIHKNLTYQMVRGVFGYHIRFHADKAFEFNHLTKPQLVQRILDKVIQEAEH